MIEEKHVQQIIVVVGFQLLSCVWFFATPWTAALPCPSLSPWVWSNSCPLNWWCYLSISSFAAPFSFYFQSFPASEYFPMRHLFTSGGRHIGASTSASVLPMNIQGWFPCSPRDSQESSPTPHLENINSLVLSLLYGPTITSTHNYWKSHSLDYTDLCRPSDISSF